MPNPYCEALGIDVPRLARVVGHSEASTYALLLVALLEAGDPLSLEEAAARIAGAGVGSPETVLRSLKRCRPDRPPVYRHGDDYHLDPFDGELSLWAFRLGLRPPRGQALPVGASPEQVEAHGRRAEERREQEAARLSALRRCVIRAFPPEAPAALVLLDVDDGRIERFAGDDLGAAPARLAEYDALAAENVRPTLLGLGMDVAARRLHELRPPQKTKQVGRRGRVIDVTTERLLRGSCGIRRRWGRDAPLRKLLEAGKLDRLLDRLEAEVVDLGALYHYGRLHGALRLRWHHVDEMLRVPWVVIFTEPLVWRWLNRAHEAGQPLEVVAGIAPDRREPWADAEWCTVYEPEGYLPVLVTAQREAVYVEDVQRLRVARPGMWHAPLPAEAAGPSTALSPRPGALGTDGRVLRVRIELELEREPVWRVIEVPADATFWDLHVAIQDAMGWQDYHLHAFRVQGPSRDEPIEIGLPLDEGFLDDPVPVAGWRVPVLRHLNAAQPDCDYTYDFGDDWRHRLHLEGIEPADPARDYPRCAAGGRACPPEDVGGPHGYERFLEALADPRHEEHELYTEWIGGRFDPEAFDVSEVSFDDPGARWGHAFAVR